MWCGVKHQPRALPRTALFDDEPCPPISGIPLPSGHVQGIAAKLSGMPYAPLILFLLLYAFASLAWRMPQLVGLAYLVTSLTCFVACAIDKSAARAQGWRTPQATLLALSLLGGWPGALLARQWLRHQTGKAAFRWKFHVTVALNLGAFAWLAWQIGHTEEI